MRSALRLTSQKLTFNPHFDQSLYFLELMGEPTTPDLLFSRAEAQRTRTPRAHASITNRAAF